MKKLLGIVILSLLLSGNAFASVEKIYLICKIKPTDVTKNTGKMISHMTDLVSIINVNYISIDKKENKVKIIIYEHQASKFWFKFKPKPQKIFSFLKSSEKTDKSEYKDGHFFYTATDKILDGDLAKITFDIYKKDNKWIVEGTDYFNVFENGVLDYTFKGDCDEFIKKDFLKIRKQGLKL